MDQGILEVVIEAFNLKKDALFLYRRRGIKGRG